jgi:hypothetical protein
MEDKIKINDKEYISVEEHDKIISEKIKEGQIKECPKKIIAKRFSPSVQSKLLMKLSDIFSSEENNSVDEEEALKGDVTVLDPANVVLVYGKSEEAKRLLCVFKNPDVEVKEIPKLEFTGNLKATSKYSSEYINKIMGVLNATGLDCHTISLQHDYPIKIENKHFAFILAPRVESADEEK